MTPTVTSGALLMFLASPLAVANMVLSKLLRDWPYYRLFGLSCFLIAVFSGGLMANLPALLPKPHDRKWVLFRGAFAIANFVLTVAAVSRVPLGDVSTLASINMVAAAFLGRAFLKEPLRCVHFLGLLSSLMGAVLISKPSFLFGTTQGGDWLGYLLALASGFFLACIYICCRKAADVSTWAHLCSTMAQGSVAGLLLPLLPFMEEPSAERLLSEPLLALAWLACVALCLLVATLLTSLAAQRCPVAVGATVNTAARMLFSYAAQALLFGEPPEIWSLTGAALMLLSVILMAGFRATSPTELEPVMPVEAEAAPEAAAEVEETESLASFIAAEFVDCSLHERAVRQRRRSLEPVALQLGVAVASVAI